MTNTDNQKTLDHQDPLKMDTEPLLTKPDTGLPEQETESHSLESEGGTGKQHPKRVTIKKLQEELEAFRTENTTIKDQYLRKLAEFDNFRKRTERDILRICANANESLVTQFLPVLDDFERALKHTETENQSESLRRGIELIYTKLYKILQDTGLKPMETDGKEFDPHLHDALMQMEKPDVPPHHIIETLEKGYYFNDKVIRHAKVSVSK
jgi:molecular chaperone GrpE